MADILKENDSLENEEEIEVVELDGEPFAVIAELEHDGGNYFALIPYSEDEEDDDEEDGEEEVEFVILKEIEENGEYFLTTIDDDDLYEVIGEKFLKLLAEED